MFAEELTGNASRKRAEENRARRRRLKAQQKPKPPPSTATAIPQSPGSDALSNGGASAVGAATVSSVQPTTSAAVLPAAGLSKPPVTRKAVGTSDVPLTAVQKAQQQREIRAQAAARNKAAARVQAFYRSYRSNRLSYQQHKKVLSQRLQDLSTLRTLLENAGKGPYMPPPATTTALVQQLLYVTTRRTSGKGKIVRTLSAESMELVQQVVDYCLLPVVSKDDTNVNPLLVWMESPEGRLRLDALIRVVLVASLTQSTSAAESAQQSLLKWIRALAVSPKSPSKDMQKLVSHVQSMMLTKSPVFFTPSNPRNDLPHGVYGSCLDLMVILRFQLLFVVAGPNPIPQGAHTLRETCIVAAAKNRAGPFLQLILDILRGLPEGPQRQGLQARLVCEILTCPLLTWKISGNALAALISDAGGSIVLVELLGSFVDRYFDILSGGDVGAVLVAEDVPMSICPATPTQCLLANLVQLARLCPALSGSDAAKLDFQAATLVFDVVASLVDAVPTGTFSSRESAVEWTHDGRGHHVPIVLAPIILEQCKLLVVDSFVRRLFQCAIDTDALDVDTVLAKKNDKDLKYEKEMTDLRATSATTLAAQEARVNRNKTFWSSSKWARKLTKGLTGLLAKDDTPSTSQTVKSEKGSGLLNTSSVSESLAAGSVSSGKLPPEAVARKGYTTTLLFALVRTYAILLARWGGGGKEDIIARSSRDSKDEQAVATAKPEVCTMAVLNVLCFSTPLVKTAWALIQSDPATVSDVHAIIDADRGKTPVRALSIRPDFSRATKAGRHMSRDGSAMLFLFVCTFAHVLIITDDVEIHDMENPLPLHQVRRSIQVLKKLLYRASCVDDTSTAVEANVFGLALITTASRTMRDLYDRSSRRPLCGPKQWIVPDLLEKEIRKCRSHGDYCALLSLPALRVCPFLVSFKRRLRLFERIITTNRIDIQGVNDANPFNTNPLKPGIPVRITRGRILEDGLATMNHLGRNMRQRIAVQYVNEAGSRESGIDAGGLFKEFWTDLSAVAFNLDYALFRQTDGAGNCLYPNPASGAAHGSDHVVLFEFLGRILGKALYEGITIHPRFAHFFLSFLRGDYNYLHMLPDLSTVDPVLYNNLMFLKTYDGDAADLCLTFSVANDDFGGNKEAPLIPNGENIDVTNANKHRYIGLVAKYYVVDRVKTQSEAFTRGLWEVIDRSWLVIFNEPELQVLISGASDGELDLADLKANTRYIGGYKGIDPTINRFWSVMESLESKKQAEVLRFVTSCERPPPLGFSSMNPPFTIQRVSILRDSEKLPTASTCFNTLKLPTYSSEKVLRQRLLYAIESGTGFELS